MQAKDSKNERGEEGGGGKFAGFVILARMGSELVISFPFFSPHHHDLKSWTFNARESTMDCLRPIHDRLSARLCGNALPGHRRRRRPMGEV
jgi:hypothetical protein